MTQRLAQPYVRSAQEEQNSLCYNLNLMSFEGEWHS